MRRFFEDLTPAQRKLLVGLAVGVGVILVAVTVAALGRSGPPEPVAAEDTTTTTEAEAPDEEDGEVDETTTTTEPEDDAEETTTTTEETTTTTTLPPEELLVLEGDGLDLVAFGDSPERVLETLTDLLGPPDEDTGWIDALGSPFGVCPGDQVRGVRWRTLQVQFTDGRTDWGDDGERHFFTYVDSLFFEEDPEPLGLTTEPGIGLLSTRVELERAYGGDVTVESDLVFGVTFTIEVPDPQFLGGALADEEPDAPITAIRGGHGCGE